MLLLLRMVSSMTLQRVFNSPLAPGFLQGRYLLNYSPDKKRMVIGRMHNHSEWILLYF